MILPSEALHLCVRKREGALIYRFSKFALDTELLELRSAEGPVAVEPQVFSLLAYLIENRGHVVSKDDLIAAIWDGRIVSDDTLHSRINAARRAVGDSGTAQAIIRTFPKRGFRFVAEIDAAASVPRAPAQPADDWELKPPEKAPIAVLLPRPCPVCEHVNAAGAESCAKCGGSLISSSSRAAHPIESGSARQIPASSPAERRQVTIMLCEMVESGAPSTLLDPEERHGVVSTFQSSCTTEIQRLGGSVAQYLGESVAGFFGYPTAHEDDAERAVRAGLAILNAVRTSKSSAAAILEARIGIATGLVVVGDLVRDGITQEKAAIGAARNLAGQLQSLAEPNTLLICPETHRLVGALFDYRDLGVRSLKGSVKAVHVHQVTSASSVESRFEARRAGVASALLGRDEELDLMRRRWNQAKHGEGRVVLLTGEAGIGKSRLTRALQDQLGKEPLIRLIFHCSPHHQDRAFYPVISQLLRAAAIGRDDTPGTRLDKLEALLAQPSENLAEEMPLFAALLSIPGGDRYPLPDLMPQQVRERTLNVLLGRLKRLSDRQPVLMVFEDIHWIDPTSLEFLSVAIEQISRLPVLLVATARPEFRAPWPSLHQISAVALNRLGRSDSQALVAGMTKGKALPAVVLEQLIAHTDGIPLFIEELTKTVLESEVLCEVGDRYELMGPLPPLAIPSTLHASLLARLDRLASAKGVAQIGAAIGREFSYAIVAAVSGLAEQLLQAALAQLVEAELIFQRGVPPDARYWFKHALVQDAAYASLLRPQRQQIHARVAEVLRTSPQPVPPITMAHHYAGAGNADQGVNYLVQASEHAVQRGENREAASHLQRAIQLIDLLPANDANDRRRLHTLLRYGPVLCTTRGLRAKETEEVYGRAHALARSVGDTWQRFTSTWGLWFTAYHQGRLEAAREHVKDLLEIASGSSDKNLIVQAHHSAWTTLVPLGEDAEIIKHAEIGWLNYDPQSSPNHVFLFGGHDPGVCSRMAGSLSFFCLGAPDRARSVIEQGVSLADQLEHPYSLGCALSFAATVDFLRRDPASIIGHVDHLVALDEKHSFSLFHLMATPKLLRGWAHAVVGHHEEALRDLDEGLTALKQMDFKRMSFQYAVVAATALLMGDRGRARQAAADASQALVEAPEPRWEPEVLRLRGVLSEDPAEAESTLIEAIAAARRNSSLSFELRAATNLAQLLKAQGRSMEAKSLLAPIYAKFTEGFTTPDLKDAKRLLDQLPG